MSLIEMLSKQLQGSGIDAISQQVGVSPEKTNQVVAGALPMLIAGLSKTASSSAGVSSLIGALDRDHDGSVLDDLAGFIGGGAASSGGAGILGHVFGARQSAAETNLSKMSGVGPSKVGQILALLAPMVMGALGRTKQKQGLDAGGLASLLGGERTAAEKVTPQLSGMLSGLLDSDGDGQVADDIADLGGKLLGSFFGR